MCLNNKFWKVKYLTTAALCILIFTMENSNSKTDTFTHIFLLQIISMFHAMDVNWFLSVFRIKFNRDFFIALILTSQRSSHLFLVLHLIQVIRSFLLLMMMFLFFPLTVCMFLFTNIIYSTKLAYRYMSLTVKMWQASNYCLMIYTPWCKIIWINVWGVNKKRCRGFLPPRSVLRMTVVS